MPDSTSRNEVGRTQARIIHAGLVAGFVLFAVISLYLSEGTPDPSLSDTTSLVFRTVGYGLLAVGMVAVAFFRSRVSPPHTGADLDEWWRTNITWAIIMWSQSEGVGLAGLIIGWQTPDRSLHISAVVVTLLLLFWCRPGSLEARR